MTNFNLFPDSRTSAKTGYAEQKNIPVSVTANVSDKVSRRVSSAADKIEKTGALGSEVGSVIKSIAGTQHDDVMRERAMRLYAPSAGDLLMMEQKVRRPLVPPPRPTFLSHPPLPP